MKKIRNWLITGLAVLFPFVATWSVVLRLVRWLDRYIPRELLLSLPMPLLWLSVVLTILLILLCGVFVHHGLGTRYLAHLELVLLKIPLYRSIYATLRQFFAAFTNRPLVPFKETVVVEYPGAGLHQLGFLLGKVEGEIADKLGDDHWALFVSTTPNPFTAVLIYAPSSEFKRPGLGFDEGLKSIISLGILSKK